MNITDFTVQVGDEELSCSLATPEKARRNDQSGLLLNISATREYALRDPTQNHPTEPFLEAGHYVLSFDLPCHGERIREHGGELIGMGRAYLAGDDPFLQFIADGKAALDACLERGIGANGKIVAYGVSRAGYCCLRLAAEDSRLRAVAALSPVTDWGVVEEFTKSCAKSKTKPLLIDNWTDELADKGVHLSIGSQDDIVGTESCVRFAMKLFKEQRRALPEHTLFNQLHVADSPSHSPARYWRLDATRYLLEFCKRLDS
jgi:hypothetical protein